MISVPAPHLLPTYSLSIGREKVRTSPLFDPQCPRNGAISKSLSAARKKHRKETSTTQSQKKNIIYTFVMQTPQKAATP